MTFCTINFFRQVLPIQKVNSAANGWLSHIAATQIAYPLNGPYYCEKRKPPNSVMSVEGRVVGTQRKYVKENAKKPFSWLLVNQVLNDSR